MGVKKLLAWILTQIFVCSRASRVNRQETEVKLRSSLQKVNDLLEKIWNRWGVSHYPLFVRTVYFYPPSWDLLKVRVEIALFIIVDVFVCSYVFSMSCFRYTMIVRL